MLCQPILLPTSYGAGVTGVVTSRAEAKLRAANVVPKNTSAIPGTTPGKRGRFIEGLPFEALSRSDFFLVLDAAHYSTASDDDVNTLFRSEVKIFSRADDLRATLRIGGAAPAILDSPRAVGP